MPTFVPHKYGGTYTQAQINHAAGWASGRFTPEEYEAIMLDKRLGDIGTNGIRNFPFEIPEGRMYSKVFEHSREL